MKQSIKSLILFSFSLLISISLWGQDDAREIFTHATDQLLTKNMELAMEMEIKDMIGSEAMFTSITAQDPDELAFMFLPPQEVEGKSCYTVVVKDKDFKDQARGELQIEMGTYRIVQISVYDMYGKQTGFVKLSDFQVIDGPGPI